MKTYGCGCSRCKDARELFQRVVSQDVKLSLDNPSGHVQDNVQDAPKGREGKPQVRYLAYRPATYHNELLNAMPRYYFAPKYLTMSDVENGTGRARDPVWNSVGKRRRRWQQNGRKGPL